MAGICSLFNLARCHGRAQDPAVRMWYEIPRLNNCWGRRTITGFVYVRIQVDYDYARRRPMAGRSISRATFMCCGVTACWESTTQKEMCHLVHHGSYMRHVAYCGDGVKEVLFVYVCGFAVSADATSRQANQCSRGQRGGLNIS